MKITINPKYDFLSDFINSLPDTFEKEGKSIHKLRNEIKIFEKNGLRINVKSYKIPIFINRIAYSFFRPSKAKRSYKYALQLLEKGFDTAEPIAVIEEYKCGLLCRSFFVSIHSDYSGDFRSFSNTDESNEGRYDLIESFARYTASLHESEVLHTDYSGGNILYEKIDGEYKFLLIDINRMKFCKVTQDMGCYNFCRLQGNDEYFDLLAKHYAMARGFDIDECVKLFHKYKNEDRKKRAKRRERKQKYAAIFK